MAGKIIADTLEHSTAGSLDTSYVVNGIAKAWLSGTVDANLTDSLNFSSGVDVDAGDFDYSLTNAAAAQMDNSYLGVTAGGAAYYGRIGTGDTTTTLVDVKIHNSSAALSDSVHFVIFVGDLA
jgi:hypothetical protein